MTATRIAGWLTSLVDSAVGESAKVEIPPGASWEEAWSAAASACGGDETKLAEVVASHFDLALADLTQSEPTAVRLVPEKVARQYGVLPLRENDRHLVVATSDPSNLDMEEALRFASGRPVRFEIAPPEAIREAFDTLYSASRTLEGILERLGVNLGESVRVLSHTKSETRGKEDHQTAPVVKMTNLILHEAAAENASDIHIEPGREFGTVRFRVDGVLREYMKLPIDALNRVVSRIKVMGSLDIADRLRPHDGHASIAIGSRAYDLRISTVPTRETEKAVIRILEPESTLGLEDLQMLDHELERLRRLLAHRSGIAVVTGPTGSGKTTTVYGGIRELATGDVNIMSVEDPVEYELAGVTQIQVEPRRGVTFASALRAILRQDPDVIFVGEIRDRETAEVAVQASATGHLVLATLHAPDAVGVVSRLIDIGLDRASIATSLRGVVAQRLVRRVCAACVEPFEGSSSPKEWRLASAYGVKPKVRAPGCKHCGHTGFRGRFPIAEVLLSDRELESKITSGAPMQELEKIAISGGLRLMQEVALERVKSGETTLEEIARVLGELPAEPVRRSTSDEVLVVDDDPVNRRVARGLLEKAGFQVAEAVDGVDALEQIERGSHSLVVLDLMMPKLDGYGVLAKLRASPRTVGLPVVVLTATGDVNAEVRLMEAGADDYVRKPIEPLRFVARIKAALRRVAAA